VVWEGEVVRFSPIPIGGLNMSRPSISERFADWYRGKYIPPPENDPDSSFVIFSLGYYEQPWLAKLLGVAWSFYVRYWQWVWSTIIALLGLYLAALALK